jgi:hypothetical protein
MSARRTFAVAVLTGLVFATTSTSAAADPDHPRCPTTTIQTRAHIPSGLSVRAIQEGLHYPVWCR